MTIAFVHPHKAFLPEIEAYTGFFSACAVKTVVVRPQELNKINADVEWHFMGTDRKKNKPGTLKIHEYTSASMPPFKGMKDLSKNRLNIKPAYRLFLNEYVKNELGFRDGIPYGFRDMGVDVSFLSSSKKHIDKKYDFIYTGSVAPEREIENLLACFLKNDLNDHSLTIVSRDYEKLAEKFSASKNIRFLGPVEHNKIKDHILEARFAINFIPGKEPFNQQTSTKLLEYLALKIPVITTDYAWVRNFQQEQGGRFFYLEKDLSNFTWANVMAHDYSFPILDNWVWEKQIRKSGVLSFLESKFADLHL